MFEQKLKLQNWFLNKSLKRSQEKVTTQVHETSFSKVLFITFLKILLLAFFGTVIIFPFFFMFSIAFMDDSQSESLSKNFQLIPNFGLGTTQEITIGADGKPVPSVVVRPWNVVVATTFARAFNLAYFRSLGITFANVLVSIFLKILITYTMGYAFSIRTWRGKSLLWFIALSLLVLPEVALLAGQYKMVLVTGLYGSAFYYLLGIALPFAASIFHANMYRNAFEAIPGRIKEVSLVDGASGAKYLFGIAFPMVMPTTLTIIILTSLASWNSYLWPSVVSSINGTQYQLISIWLFNAGKVDGDGGIPVSQNIKLAAVIISILPVFVVYMVFRKYIMRAISRQGSTIKG